MSAASRRDTSQSAAQRRAGGEAAPTRLCGAPQGRAGGHTLWMFDFDNTLAPLEPAVDWAKSRRELQAWLGAQGVAEALFEEFPQGNLVLYEALRARLCAGGDAARAVLARGELADELAAALNGGQLVRQLECGFGGPERGGGRKAAAPLRALLDGASAIIERHELAGVGAVAPAPGAHELLRALRAAGGTVAIVTSNSSRTVAAWLRAWAGERLADPEELADPVDAVDLIVGRDSGLALKPSPATVARALADCEVSPADAIFVGDSEADLKAANSAAVRFYGVNAKAEGRDRLTALGASPVFSSPAALAVYFDLLDPLGVPIDRTRVE